MSKSVLIVDDSQIVLDLNSFALSSAGYNVFTALGGMEALEIMNKNTIQLVAVDINMPGMDGYTLIRKIRNDEIFTEIPAIIITTEQEAGDMKKGFDAGANAYLVKPFEPEELIAHIELLIGKA